MNVYIGELGKYLNKVIKDRNTTQAAIAKKLNISRSSLSNIINDKAAPSFISKLISIADCLNINSITIVFKKDEKKYIKKDSIDLNMDLINIKDVSPHVKKLIFKLIEEDKIAKKRNKL